MTYRLWWTVGYVCTTEKEFRAAKHRLLPAIYEALDDALRRAGQVFRAGGVAWLIEGDDKTQFIADITSGDLKIKNIAREQLNVRVFGNTAVLTARDSATWLYHGRELAGQYKILSVFSERNGAWQLCAVQACPMQQTVAG